MTKKEKEVLDLILEEVSGIRNIMLSMFGSSNVTIDADLDPIVQIEEADLAPADEVVMKIQEPTSADDVVDRMNEEHMTSAPDPITDDERAAYNDWLIACAKFVGDQGEFIKLILQTAGVKGMSEVNDRALLETITNEVKRVMAEKSGA